MMRFVGRRGELGVLRSHFKAVSERGEGRLLSVRGRRQVGKSRLIEEFQNTCGVPSIYFTAAKGTSLKEEIRGFAADISRSDLEAAPLFSEVIYEGWEATLRLLAANISTPTIVVLDELPYLLSGDPSLEGTLQRVWDRHLSRVPILLIVVGSDLSVMEMLGNYDRPLYQRMHEMVINPFTVAETAEMLNLGAQDAFDAYLVLGGFPTLINAWHDTRKLSRFLQNQLGDPTSPLLVVGERILNAEFPPEFQARDVLQVIGSGETTFGSISRRSGINEGSLTRTLQVLTNDKRVVGLEKPLSAKATRHPLYRVDDPYLRFWLHFIGPNMDLLMRGRGDLLMARISEAWSAYRGKAIEPIVRSSIERLLPDECFGQARYVGGYWSRSGDVGVDLVGSLKPQSPTPIAFIGSIKWRERSAFNRHDLANLAGARADVPGAEDALLVGVSRSGFTTEGLDISLGPSELLSVWE